MKLSPYVIQKLAPIVNGDSAGPYRKGKELVLLFNEFGATDIYDHEGLPKYPGKDRRMSRTEYAEIRLREMNNGPAIRPFLEKIINASDNKENTANTIDELLKRDGYSVVEKDSSYYINGGVVINTIPIVNQSFFENIEQQILDALDAAEVSIVIAMAWFTNEKLFNKLLEKRSKGVDVRILIYDDGVNRKHGVDIDQLNPIKVKRALRGGLMHNKFCVIDNQVVIEGSYNWTNNAEHKNDENITIQYDPKLATNYSKEFRRLSQPKS